MNTDLAEQVAYIDGLLAPQGWSRHDEDTWASWVHPTLMVAVVYHPGRWSVHVSGQPSSHAAITSRNDINIAYESVERLCAPASA